MRLQSGKCEISSENIWFEQARAHTLKIWIQCIRSSVCDHLARRVQQIPLRVPSVNGAFGNLNSEYLFVLRNSYAFLHIRLKTHNLFLNIKISRLQPLSSPVDATWWISVIMRLYWLARLANLINFDGWTSTVARPLGDALWSALVGVRSMEYA